MYSPWELCYGSPHTAVYIPWEEPEYTAHAKRVSSRPRVAKAGHAFTAVSEAPAGNNVSFITHREMRLQQLPSRGPRAGTSSGPCTTAASRPAGMSSWPSSPGPTSGWATFTRARAGSRGPTSTTSRWGPVQLTIRARRRDCACLESRCARRRAACGVHGVCECGSRPWGRQRHRAWGVAAWASACSLYLGSRSRRCKGAAPPAGPGRRDGRPLMRDTWPAAARGLGRLRAPLVAHVLGPRSSRMS